jgi:hypothetical protein
MIPSMNSVITRCNINMLFVLSVVYMKGTEARKWVRPSVGSTVLNISGCF